MYIDLNPSFELPSVMKALSINIVCIPILVVVETVVYIVPYFSHPMSTPS